MNLKGVIAKRVYSLRQAKMLTVAVVPHKQADYQMLSGCILPERKPQAVKLLFCSPQYSDRYPHVWAVSAPQDAPSFELQVDLANFA